MMIRLVSTKQIALCMKPSVNDTHRRAAGIDHLMRCTACGLLGVTRQWMEGGEKIGGFCTMYCSFCYSENTLPGTKLDVS
jgi:hypothetical protein